MNLLPIKLTDDNKKIKDLPDLIFGYIGAGDLNKIDTEFDPTSLRIRNNIENTARKGEWYFKINKYSSSNIKFEGYISDQADSILNQNKDLVDVDIQVFPKTYAEYKNRKEFCLNDANLIIRPRYLRLDSNTTQWILDISKRSVSSNRSLHNFSKDINTKVTLDNHALKNKVWYEKWWGQIIVGVIVMFVGTVILKMTHII